jgi:hypothetical protein
MLTWHRNKNKVNVMGRNISPLILRATLRAVGAYEITESPNPPANAGAFRTLATHPAEGMQ